MKTLYTAGNTAIVRQIALDIDNRANVIELDEKLVRKGFSKLGIDTTDYIPKKLSDVDDNDCDDFCRMFSAWFIAKKGVLLGRIIGEAIPAENIPACYSDAIQKAQEVAANA